MSPSHEGDEPLGHSLVVVRPLHAVEHIQFLHLFCHLVSVFGGQLGAVLPVDLVAVVLLGIVAGGDIDACLAVVLPHGEAQLRGGAQGLEDPHMDAVGGADLSGGTGELHGVVAAVHADGHAPVLARLALGADHVGKALGSPADDVDVHIVQSGVHGAPQSGGAELQRTVEPGLDLLGVGTDGFQLRVLFRGQSGACKPLFIFFHEIHTLFLLLIDDTLRDAENALFTVQSVSESSSDVSAASRAWASSSRDWGT